MVHFVQSPTDYWRDWMTWRLEEERRLSKLHHYWERPDYWEESWRLEDTCCHSDFSERPSVDADVKNSGGVNNNNNNKWKGKYQHLVWELKKKTMEHESNVDANSNWRARYSQGLAQGLKGVEITEQVGTIKTTTCWYRPEY